MMARRRRGQNPEPKKERGSWKIRYWADVAQPDGSIERKKRTKCLGRVSELTLKEAQKEARRFLQPINDVEEGTEHADKTVNQLIAQWRIAVKPNLKRSTQESYEWAFKRLQPAFGSWGVCDIGKAEIQGFLTHGGRQLAGESVRDLKARLSGLFSVAEEWGWIRTNPCKGRFRLPERVPVREKVILSPAEFWKLHAALKPPYSVILLLAVLSGLRKGEIAALRRSDVSEAGVMVDEAVYRGTLSSPKTKRSRRMVTVGPIVRKALAEWMARAKFNGPTDFLFSIRRNTPIDLHNAVARHIKPACRELGIREVSWHDLRHTFTTWGRRAGVAPESMRDQLGHSSVLMTLDVYSHAEDRQEMAAAIERYAWPEAGSKVA